jgi:hypothetical protein
VKRIELKVKPSGDEAKEMTLVESANALVKPMGGFKVPTPAAMDLVERLSSKGMSEGAIAYCIGVSNPTWISWKDKYPELMERLRRGQARGVNLAAEVVYRGLQQGDKACAIFYLKSKDNWRENAALPAAETPVSKANSALIAALHGLTDDELRELATLLSRGASRVIVDGRGVVGTSSPTPS